MLPSLLAAVLPCAAALSFPFASPAAPSLQPPPASAAPIPDAAFTSINLPFGAELLIPAATAPAQPASSPLDALLDLPAGLLHAVPGYDLWPELYQGLTAALVGAALGGGGQAGLHTVSEHKVQRGPDCRTFEMCVGAPHGARALAA